MKRFLILAVVYIFSLAGCSGSSPADVATSYYKKIEQGKVNDAYSMLSAGTKTMLTTFGVGQTIFLEESKKVQKSGGIKEYKVVKEEEIGDTATVKMEIVYGNGKSRKVTENLIKEDGKWRIAMKK